jgi:hypothetical protein
MQILHKLEFRPHPTDSTLTEFGIQFVNNYAAKLYYDGESYMMTTYKDGEVNFTTPVATGTLHGLTAEEVDAKLVILRNL